MLPGSQHFASIQSKTSFYRGDGSGKDLYILTDSGGFRKGGIMSPKGFEFRSGSPSRSNRAGGRQDGKTIHYQSDGSGRDHYITSNTGGFSRFSTGEEYCSTLRNYDKVKSPIHNNKDYFGWAQVVNRSRERAEEKQKSFVIKSVISRLSPPKTRPDLSLTQETSSLAKSKSLLNLARDSSHIKSRPILTLINDQSPKSPATKSKAKFILRTDYTPIKTSSKLALGNDYDDSAYMSNSKTSKMREIRKKIYE
jgi:hypothetical protein